MDFLSQEIANFIFALSNRTTTFWQNLAYSNVSWWQVVLDVLVVGMVLYYIFSLLKGSRAVNILVGLMVLSFFFVISKTLQLLTLGWLLDRFFTVALVAIPVIFQQELRMGLERLGIKPFFTSEKSPSTDAFISAVVEACAELAKKKSGALLVIQHGIPLKEYIDTGVGLDATVSKELLLAIFDGKGPLHDGAVIIDKQKIVAAGCVLPNTYSSIEKNLGTRHKAAIGVTEHTDASGIAVSEEKGTIAFSKNGRLEKDITPARLQQILKILLQPNGKAKKKKYLKYRENNSE